MIGGGRPRTNKGKGMRGTKKKKKRKRGGERWIKRGGREKTLMLINIGETEVWAPDQKLFTFSRHRCESLT